MKSNVSKILISLILLLFITTFFSTSILAEGEIKLNVSPGYNGAFKATSLVPIRVTITNNSKEDIEGDLKVVIKNNYESAGTYYQPVSIAKNTSKSTTILVSGEGLLSQTEVKLVRDNKVIATSIVGGRSFSADSLFIGTLASDKDTGNFLGRLNNNQAITRIHALSEEDITSSALGLKGLDILLINNYSLDRFDQQQINSIKKWVEDGGVLIIGTGPEYLKVTTSFSELLPIEITGVTEISNVKALEEVSNKPLFMNRPISMSTGNVKNGRVLYQEGNIPLFVLSEWGRGKVLYSAYDLAAEPLASWSGNNELWEAILFKEGVVQTPNTNPKMDPYYNNWWALRNASDRIPSLELPKLSTLITLFGIYIFVVGPLLYFLLKKAGRREMNWLIIPAISILIAFGVYQFAFFNRGSEVMLHNVSLLQLSKEQEAKVISVSGIFVPKQGSYKLSFHDVDKIKPINDYNENSADNIWISHNAEESNVIFKNVEFWSIRRVYLEKYLSNIGSIESNLNYENGKLIGSIRNNTSYPIKDAKFLMGSQVQDLGDLEVGASVDVDIHYSTHAPKQGLNFHQLLPNNIQNNPRIYQTREYQMLEMLNMEWNYGMDSVTPSLIGWIEQPVLEGTVKDARQEAYHLTLVKSELEIMPNQNGDLFFPQGYFESTLIQSPKNTDIFHEGYMVPTGKIAFEFDLKNNRLDYDIKAIQFYLWSNDQTKFDKRIYNWSTNSYDSYDEVTVNNILEDNIQQYVSKDGALRIELSHNISNSHRHLGFPMISVEGREIK